MTEGRQRDLLVVGGGPAGLATALAARQRGMERVTVLDGRRPPVDKPCGEGLMPDGVAQLERLGVRLPEGRCAPFTGIRYLDGETVAEGSFPNGAAGAGLGVRRTVLHGTMVEAAEAAGVELRWGIKANGLLPRTLVDEASSEAGVETEDGPLTARWVVAADGLNSRVRGWAELHEETAKARRRTRGRPRRFGVRRHFWVTPWNDKVEVYWGEGIEAYVTPVAHNQVGIAFLVADESAHFDLLLARFPALAARLEGAEIASRAQGRGLLEHRVTAVARGRLALVGDASGYVDAITGEGLSLAFHQAEALADALAQGSFSGYQRAHRAIGRLPDGMTRLMLALERRPWLRRRAIRALAAKPELFDRLLAVHCRELPLTRFGPVHAASLVRHLLWPGDSQKRPPQSKETDEANRVAT